MDKFSTVSHSIISHLTVPICSHKCGLAAKIFCETVTVSNHLKIGVIIIIVSWFGSVLSAKNLQFFCLGFYNNVIALFHTHFGPGQILGDIAAKSFSTLKQPTAAQH